MELIHRKKMTSKSDKNKDPDYERDDLEDADDEELEDRVVAESRRLSRPLRQDEVSRLSQVSGMGS